MVSKIIKIIAQAPNPATNPNSEHKQVYKSATSATKLDKVSTKYNQEWVNYKQNSATTKENPNSHKNNIKKNIHTTKTEEKAEVTPTHHPISATKKSPRKI